MNFNNYYTYNNGNQLVSTPYDRQSAELIAIMAMRNNANLIETNIVDNRTGEIVKTYIQ